tara:strand:+ start:365 stop:808 length:444 start_codon:yes stop_codon:yes gene_type:complete
MANGTIAFDTLQTSGQITGTAKSVDTDFVVNGSAKCWINFNGTGTIATRDSFNVSSITDNGTGIFTVTINNDFANVNYSATIGSCGYDGGNDTRFQNFFYGGASGVGGHDWSNYVAGSFQVMNKNVANDSFYVDPSLVTINVHGDLA